MAKNNIPSIRFKINGSDEHGLLFTATGSCLYVASWYQTLDDAASYYNEHRDYLSNLLTHTNGHDSFIRNMTEIHHKSLRKRIVKADFLL